MAFGSGKYDDLCTEAREKANARGVILVIIEGDKGFGFSVQAEPRIVLKLPETLRRMAQMIADDLMKGKLMEHAYPKEDKCRYCGAHIGWLLHPMAESLALGVCDKKECQDKDKQRKEEKEDVDS